MKAQNKKGEDDIQHASRTSTTGAPKALRIVIAGGVTGGHLFPGIAIAQEFMTRNPESRIIFAGAGKPFEISALSNTGFEHWSITAQGIKGLGFLKKMKSVLKIPRGTIESILFLRDFKPDIVVGVGGYAAGPVALGARFLGIKIVLHEQNILPGITNRFLSHFADRIYVSFDNTKKFMHLKKTLFTGNPVRREIMERERMQPCSDRAVSGTVPRKERLFKILIIGGSQGAHSINMAVVDALDQIKNTNAFSFVHQTGLQDEEMVKNAYTRKGISCTVKSFFSDMARQYERADLVICRAGATTIAEITALGKGVLFIPFPHAADNHQVLNAQTLVRLGAAEMILEKDLNGKSLAKRIEQYSADPESLDEMASRAKRHGKPDAARVIVDDCYQWVGGV
ncbi:MAG: undecaprenyldiphospho-muramoylpentapeptide beta-N-acetylglucosaminyltransferase [Deltaproteobacteria bacterium]|nr:undecaprenyldiphospho-muramoylpentapeptide beta-N-acetylglucosaminyltransferase [Deltaproteobacteria bacterium]